MIMNLIIWLIFGAIAGWVASIIMHTNSEQGPLANIIIGILGAFLGGFISRALGGPGVDAGFNLMSLIIAILGAIVLLAVVRMFTRHSTV